MKNSVWVCIEVCVLAAFCCYEKHYDQKLLEEERFYLSYMSQSQSITKGSQDNGDSGRSRTGNWRKTGDWLASRVLFSHHSYTAQVPE